jgi:hypothetical protein
MVHLLQLGAIASKSDALVWAETEPEQLPRQAYSQRKRLEHTEKSSDEVCVVGNAEDDHVTEVATNLIEHVTKGSSESRGGDGIALEHPTYGLDFSPLPSPLTHEVGSGTSSMRP